MELYQIRYFLAVARTLNFTRAAEECNVSQPALTKAIQKLEDEFGGALFRREGRRSHITELGKNVQPMLAQCYQSANAARSMADAIGKGDLAPLKIGISETIAPGILEYPISEMKRAFPGLEVDLVRATNAALLEQLESAEIELAFVIQTESFWDRLNIWNLFDDKLGIAVPGDSQLASLATLTLEDVAQWPILVCGQCIPTNAMLAEMSRRGLRPTNLNKISSELDLPVIARGTGSLAVISRQENLPEYELKELEDIDLSQKVTLVAVAGRQYSKAGATFIHLVRAMDWQGEPPDS